jgi:hypothetical protein
MDVLPANRRVLAMIGRRWPGARYEFAPDSVTVRAQLSLAGRARGTAAPAGPAAGSVPRLVPGPGPAARSQR